MTDADFPALYNAADTASLAAQRYFFWALKGNLAGIVIAAAMSVVNVPSPIFAVLQVVPLLATLALTIYLATKQPQRIWYGTRALAESVKTVAWRYMMRAEPFNGEDDADREHFIRSLRKIFEANKQISSHAVQMTSPHQITATMRVTRALPLGERKTIYEEQRVENQHIWYQNRAAANDRLSQTWFCILILVNVAAVLFALAKVILPKVEFWPTDVLVAAAGAIMAWLQTKRYQELAASYALTTHEIGLLRAVLPDHPSEAQFSVYVGDAENAFSREHTQWQARRDAD
jgi:hypothetical protein